MLYHSLPFSVQNWNGVFSVDMDYNIAKVRGILYASHRYFEDMIALMTAVTAAMISYDLIKTIRDPF